MQHKATSNNEKCIWKELRAKGKIKRKILQMFSTKHQPDSAQQEQARFLSLCRKRPAATSTSRGRRESLQRHKQQRLALGGVPRSLINRAGIQRLLSLEKLHKVLDWQRQVGEVHADPCKEQQCEGRHVPHPRNPLPSPPRSIVAL